VTQIVSRKKKRRRKMSPAGALVMFLMFIVTILGLYGIVQLLTSPSSQKSNAEEVALLETETETETESEAPTETETEAPTDPPPLVVYPEKDSSTKVLGAELNAQYAVLIDCDEHKILSAKNSDVKMYPASMTKLMTLIVAIENTEDFQETFEMTHEILEDLWSQSASMVGFSSGEQCTIMDMLYGAALPSGADATVGLAIHTAGSERAFVRLMNRKARELGLKNTHFMNTSGLHDENHYTTVEDMAVILEYCLQNEICRKVISTPTYITTPTEQHPDGITLTDTMFNKMDGTEVPGITIKGGKTGFTDEAGHTLASYAMTPDGHCYIAVTGKGTDRFKPVDDAFVLYGSVTGTYPPASETAVPAQ